MGRKLSAEGSLSETRVDVEFQIAPVSEKDLSAAPLQRAAQNILLLESVVGQVTLVITDDKGIQALNRDFLGHDTPTDVLAFSAQEDDGNFVTAPGAGGYLGDVIISYSRALDQARERGHPVDEELCLLIIHGMLHLLGYDHENEKQKQAMWTKQGALLAQCMGDQELWSNDSHTPAVE